MNLYLVRHGEALSRAESHVAADAERPLSPTGRRAVAALGRRWKARGVRADAVLTSPAVRAMQTAELLAVRIGATVEISDALAIGREPAAFLDLLEGRPRARTLIAVGHHPQLAEIATQLAFGQVLSGLAIPPGGVCWVELLEFPKVLSGTIRGLWNADGRVTHPES